MRPILFTIPGINLDMRAYGLAMASAFILCIWLGYRRALRERIDPDIILNSAFWVIVGTLVGGRALFVVTQISRYDAHWWDAFKVWEGGLVYYGGLFGSLLFGTAYIRFFAGQKLFEGKYLGPVYDVYAPLVGLGLAIHRAFGCFLNGCCYGSPTSSVFGVRFPHEHPSIALYGENVYVHPAQLYEALNGLSIFVLCTLWRRYFRKSYGELLGLMFVIYAINRFFIEFLRGDPVREFVGWTIAGWQISTSQAIGLAALPFGLALMIGARIWGKKIGEEDPGERHSPFFEKQTA